MPSLYRNSRLLQFSTYFKKCEFLRNICFLITFVSLPVTGAMAQMGPDYWQVSGVGGNDQLNIRSGPSTRNPIVATAPNGFTFRNLGCRGSGKSRWCHVETPNGRTSGWVSGRFLREAGVPVANNQRTKNVPELYVRQTGEIEVGYRSGCTVLFNPIGRRINAGSSCNGGQLSRAHDAVERYMREQSPSVTHGPDKVSQNVNLQGRGTLYGGDALTGSIFGHKEGAYALVLKSSGGSTTCTGLIKHVPGSVKSEATAIHCTNGSHGTGVLARNRSGNGFTLSFNFNDSTGGYVIF